MNSQKTQDPDRRSFLTVATLAGGGVILGLAASRQAAAQGRQGGRPPQPPPNPNTRHLMILTTC